MTEHVRIILRVAYQSFSLRLGTYGGLRIPWKNQIYINKLKIGPLCRVRLLLEHTYHTYNTGKNRFDDVQLKNGYQIFFWFFDQEKEESQTLDIAVPRATNPVAFLAPLFI